MKRYLPLIALVLFLAQPADAQLNNTLYYMHGVPQVNRVNPAARPACNFYFGVPGLAPLRTNVGSSSLSWEDVILPHPGNDSLMTILHPLADQEAFLNELKQTNILVSDVGTTFLSLGFNTGIGYLSFDLSTRLEGQFNYPGELFRLVLEGAGEGETYNMDGTGLNLSVFNQASFGWSKDFGDRWRVGARASMLFGLGNLTNTNSDLSVYTSSEKWTVDADMNYLASLPFADVEYGDDGMISDVVIEQELMDLNRKAITNEAFNLNNLGMSVSLGVSFAATEWLDLSVSLLDLGYIHWKDELHELNYQITYDYVGLEMNPLEFASGDLGMDQYMDSVLTTLVDTFSSAIDMNPTDPYMSMLNSKLYVGASFNLTPKINFGFLSRTDFLSEAIIQQFTASANVTTGRFLSLSLSYSYMNSNYKNLGLGLALNLGFINAYVITDNGLSTALWPKESRNVNIWVGLNIAFGYKNKVKHDYPLVQ